MNVAPSGFCTTVMPVDLQARKADPSRFADRRVSREIPNASAEFSLNGVADASLQKPTTHRYTMVPQLGLARYLPLR